MITKEELKKIRFVVNSSNKNLRTDGKLYKAYSITPVSGVSLKIECYLKYMTPQRHVLFFANDIDEATAILKTEKERYLLKKINPKLKVKEEKVVEEPVKEVTEPIEEIQKPVVEEKEEVDEAPVEEEAKITETEEKEEVVEAPVEEVEEIDYSKMSKNDLVEECKKKGLDSSGTKKDLIKKLSN